VAIEALNATRPGVSVNVGRIEGGRGPSTVAGSATALLDVRWEHEDERAELQDMLERVVTARAPDGCRSDLHLLNARPAWPRQGAGETLLKWIQSVGQSLGQKISSEHRRGTSDANFFGNAGIPTLDGLGPRCWGDHTPGEYILIPSLGERTALLAFFLARLREGAGAEGLRTSLGAEC
jgi:glutamate carboxypeptidase